MFERSLIGKLRWQVIDYWRVPEKVIAELNRKIKMRVTSPVVYSDHFVWRFVFCV